MKPPKQHGFPTPAVGNSLFETNTSGVSDVKKAAKKADSDEKTEEMSHTFSNFTVCAVVYDDIKLVNCTSCCMDVIIQSKRKLWITFSVGVG